MARILAYLQYYWFSFLLWVDDFGSDAKSSKLPLGGSPQPTRTTRNDKLARGVRHLLGWMRRLTAEERQQLIDNEENILQRAGMSRRKTLIEKMEEAKSAAKLVAGPREEGEQAMAETFVKNQRKYHLQARLRALHKEAAKGVRPIDEVVKELEEVKRELKGYK
jgi:hypothetical protein